MLEANGVANYDKGFEFAFQQFQQVVKFQKCLFKYILLLAI